MATPRGSRPWRERSSKNRRWLILVAFKDMTPVAKEFGATFSEPVPYHLRIHGSMLSGEIRSCPSV
jgi:hypothetical protein